MGKRGKQLNQMLTKENLTKLRKKYKISTIASMVDCSESWVKTLCRRYNIINNRK